MDIAMENSFQLIAKQAEDHKRVVLYNRQRSHDDAVADSQRPGTTVTTCNGASTTSIAQ